MTDEEIDKERKILGLRGEQTATWYLEQNNYQILERNWHCRYGEIDIIAQDPNGVIAFIEVKTRRSVSAGLPQCAVTRNKQARIERIAMSYLNQEQEVSCPVRFDVVAICVMSPQKVFLKHFEGSFEGSSE